MDSLTQGAYSHNARDRSRHSLPHPGAPVQLPRAPSRASNSTSNTRASPSANSSSSNLAKSVASTTYPYRSQQYHSRGSIASERDRPRSSRLSREATNEYDTRLAVSVASSYLQEKLQRERRFESGRSSASRTSSDAMSATAEVRAVQSSPVRASTSDGRRPRSSGGDAAKKKAMGLMEMEQTITKMHKVNFDLKFELYHRRERQTELESSLESLKTERSELEDLNDSLMQELEKRDKAIEEAVAMIVTLEASAEKLQKENDILRAVRADPLGRQSMDMPSPKTPRPEDAPSQYSHLNPHDRTLNRMPSFFSEISENTENLRNVYLENTGSLRRVSDPMRDDEMGNHKLMSAPSLSVLSESSFVSVYGHKSMLHSSSSPPPRSDPADGNEASAQKRQQSPNPLMTPAPQKNRRGSASSRKYPSGAFTSINDVLDASPLQKLQRSLQMDGNQSYLNDIGATNSGTPTSLRIETGTPQNSTLSPEQQQRAHQRLRQEKREALRKVMTDGPRDLGSNLPPTPDTISTSTLRRFKNSNDALPHHQHPGGASLDRSFGASSEGSTSRSVSAETASAEQTGRRVSRTPSTSAFHGRRQGPRDSGAYFENRQPIPRPRSADETTSSRGGREANGWGPDSSDDEFDDGASVSSTDCWMREGLKPNRRFPNNGAILAGEEALDSPDLFSFPAQAGGSGGWATGAMFGDLGGAGYFGSGPAPTANALDALGASLPAPQAGIFGSGLASPGPAGSVPPPPRRSSLHAHTSSTGTASMPPSNRAAPPAKLRKSPMRPGSRGRSNSVDVDSEQPPTPTLAATPTTAVPGEPSKRHYPPIAGQQQPPRRSGGLHALFRRSIGSSADMPPQPPASAPPPETGFKSAYPPPPPQQSPTSGSAVGIPSWSRRGDELSSSTPPPILRNPRVRRSTMHADVGAGEGYEDHQGGAPLSPAFPSPGGRLSGTNVANVQAEEQQQPSPGGRKRGWLGLGRVTSLRKHGG
ncbi:hypothetical protein GGTG_13730 [Gaeumannomyces tritici R3-111a-1]|uniref:Centrosomin N-terminal motif 1 domain-containing protein n=1 Tax=Gaeumannomyces tritici (strain R3-111a-1) TaxID=644352 RepID=J3PJP2_GAET3|nr:hypothetical protein GGTG_13730 [Gaeumannomyces tritici R3-111a-1]EJT68702.1 hypothetical protein GGTG_13730 [Gaeumannomyces tritici R3-111a-1]